MTRDLYPPSEDTFLLRDAAVDEARPDDLVLEVGTGSGVVAEALSDETHRVVATDLTPPPSARHAKAASRQSVPTSPRRSTPPSTSSSSIRRTCPTTNARPTT